MPTTTRATQYCVRSVKRTTLKTVRRELWSSCNSCNEKLRTKVAHVIHPCHHLQRPGWTRRVVRLQTALASAWGASAARASTPRTRSSASRHRHPHRRHPITASRRRRCHPISTRQRRSFASRSSSRSPPSPTGGQASSLAGASPSSCPTRAIHGRRLPCVRGSIKWPSGSPRPYTVCPLRQRTVLRIECDHLTSPLRQRTLLIECTHPTN